MKIPIVFFSATGGTEYILKFVKMGLEKQGFMVDLLPIQDEITQTLDIKEIPILGIASPIYDFNFSLPIRNWIVNLPPSQSGQKIILIDTTAGLPCDSIRVVREILEQKNYSVIGALEVLTPIAEPFFSQKFYPIGWKRANFDKAYFFGWKIGKNIRNSADGYVDYSIKHVGASKLTNWVLKWEKQGGFYDDIIKFDVNSCTQCRICERSCPMGIISLNSERMISEGCIFCATCVRNCPTHAMSIKYRPNAHLPQKNSGLKIIRGYIDPKEYIPTKYFSLSQNYWHNY